MLPDPGSVLDEDEGSRDEETVAKGERLSSATKILLVNSYNGKANQLMPPRREDAPPMPR